MQLSLIARLAQKDIHYLWFAIFASHFFLFVLHRFDARTALLVSAMDAVLISCMGNILSNEDHAKLEKR